MYCQNCGMEIPNNAVFCPKCGAAISGSSQGYSPHSQQVHVIHEYHQAVSPKSRTVAFLLAIFLGGLGVHRFYVGKVGTGILWLCTGGVCGIGWLIDIIMTGAGCFRDCYGMPIRTW